MAFRPGFQGSETSRAEVTIYSFGDEPGLFQFGGKFVLSGPEANGGPVLISVETHNALGAPAGTFTFDVKADAAGRDLIGAVSDDDWVDITFTKHSIQSHVMRGQIEDVRRVTSIGGNGATMDVVRFTGRTFGRVFDLQTIWFDVIGDDAAVVSGATARVIDANGLSFGEPATTVEMLLSGFMRELNGVGRAMWEMPGTMPNLVAHTDELTQEILGGAIIDNVAFYDTDFLNYPSRMTPITPQIMPVSNQSVWQYAMGWADLDMCEIYTELLTTAGVAAPVVAKNAAAAQAQHKDRGFPFPISTVDYPDPTNDWDDKSTVTSTDPQQTVMALVYRDRPYPTIPRAKADGVTPEAIEDGPWFTRLKTYEVHPEHLTERNIGRAGHERKNAFYASPRAQHELVGGYFDLQGPLWNQKDMRRHGFRRLDVLFDYLPLEKNLQSAGDNLVHLAEVYRQRIRDFQCMNHLFTSGSVTLGHGRPDIRIGQKLRVVGRSEDENETYYIETVHNVWALTSGVRTTVGVTRGWTGTDRSLLDTFNTIVESYERPSPSTGIKETQPEPHGPVATTVPGTLSKAEHYPPYDSRTIALFSTASATAGVPSTWADPSTSDGIALHELLKNESAGYVGRPVGDYGARARDVTQWPSVWAEIKAGIRNGEGPSSATGLGQLQPANIDLYYPSGRSGIGVASEEATGMLKYIKVRYGTPSAAWAFWQAQKPFHWY